MKQSKKTIVLVLLAVLLSLLLHVLITVEGLWHLLLHPLRALTELRELFQQPEPQQTPAQQNTPQPQLKEAPQPVQQQPQDTPKAQATKVTTIPFEELPKREQQHIIRHTRNLAAQPLVIDTETIGTDANATTTPHMPVEQPKGPEVAKDKLKQEDPNKTHQPLYSAKIDPQMNQATTEQDAEINDTIDSKEEAEDTPTLQEQTLETIDTALRAPMKKKKKRKKVKKEAPYGQPSDGQMNGTETPIFSAFSQDRFYSTLAQMKGSGELDLNHLDAGDTRFTSYTNRIGRAIRTSLDALMIKKTYYRIHIERFNKEHRKARVEFVIGKSGAVERVTILKSSGIPEVDQFIQESFMDIGSALPPFPKWITYDHIKLALWITGDPADHASHIPSFGSVATW